MAVVGHTALPNGKFLFLRALSAASSKNMMFVTTKPAALELREFFLCAAALPNLHGATVPDKAWPQRLLVQHGVPTLPRKSLFHTETRVKNFNFQHEFFVIIT